jgi:CheY-like chemotaxis protein
MSNVLLIDLTGSDATALHMALGRAGHRVTAVGTGLFALTMVERDRPDIIISPTNVSDIDGYELCSIIRSDPATHNVPFLLLAGPDGGDAGAASRVAATGMIAHGTPVDTIVTEVARRLGREIEPALIDGPAGPRRESGIGLPVVTSARASDAAVIVDGVVDRPRASDGGARPQKDDVAGEAVVNANSPAPRGPAAGPTFQGSLDIMDLADLTQAMGNSGKTGHLTVRLPHGDGVIVFEAGRVVHAEHDGRFGEAAFGTLVSAAHRDSGQFSFTPLDRYSAIAPRTIHRSIEQLLLSIAADIDEGRTGAAAIAPGA